MSIGPFVGFCPRCRNKVRSPYTMVWKEALIHISQVEVRYADVVCKETCGGVLKRGSLGQASAMQTAAGFHGQQPRDSAGRRPFVDRTCELSR